MKANSNRGSALQFGAVAEAYDAGRIGFESPLFHTVVGALLPSAGRVFEFGAGTGLLTRAIEAEDRNLELLVTEPDERLLRVLEVSAASSTTVKKASLQDIARRNLRSFDVVVCANTLHWIDPAEASTLVDNLLAPGGFFLSLWNFPLIKEAGEIESTVKALGYSTHLFERDSEQVRQSVDEGTREFTSGSPFSVTHEIEYEDRIAFDAESVAKLISSYRIEDCADKESDAELERVVRQLRTRFLVNNLVIGWIVARDR